MIGVFIRCDEPGCQTEYRSTYRWANKSDLIKSARFRGWQVGKEKHYCPQHRKVKKA